MPDQAPEAEARAFAASFRSFLDWIHATDQTSGQRNEVAVLVADFLGPEAAAHSVVSRDLPPFEHVNLQTAIDAWSRAPAGPSRSAACCCRRTSRLRAPAARQRRADAARLRLTAPPLVDLPNGPDSTLGCLRLALLLVSDARGRYVLHGAEPERAPPGPAGRGRRACRSPRPRPSSPSLTSSAPSSTSTAATCST